MRYKPGEAIRWLEMGADNLREAAQKQGRSVFRREGERSIGRDLKQTASAIADLGLSAWADLKSKQMQGTEYVLHDEFFEILEGGQVKTIRYADVLSVKLRDEDATMVFERGSIHIKPQAHIVSGKVKVPVGWTRNGMEVPWRLLVEELAARSGVRLDEEA